MGYQIYCGRCRSLFKSNTTSTKPCTRCDQPTEMVRKTVSNEGCKPKVRKESICPNCYDQAPLDRWVECP